MQASDCPILFQVQGQVKNPGRYQFNQGLTVTELVTQAGVWSFMTTGFG